MTEERYIAAIEISSSKIIGAVGRTGGNGGLEVIDVEFERGVDAVRYGIIQNLEETSLRIGRIIEKLERKPSVAPRKISGVFVGLSGRSLRSIEVEASMTLPHYTEITDEMLRSLKTDAERTKVDSSLKVIDAIPRTYFVDKRETPNPKGTLGSSLKGVFDLIVCRPELEKNVIRTLCDKLDIKIQGEVVTALACGHLILTPDEKRLGCMLVDMGAETTTVTIYTNAHLRYFVTIPLGGRNITRDLTSLSLLEERAEEMKKTSGNAIASENRQSLNIGGIRQSDVSNLVVARSEEIVANIIEQLNYAGVSEKELPGGIIVIGGGSRLNGIMELLEKKSGMSVRHGQLPQYVSLSDGKGAGREIAELVSILYAGATKSDAVCLELPPQRGEMPANGVPNSPEEPRDIDRDNENDRRGDNPKGSGFWKKIGGKISTLFAPPDDSNDSELL